MLDIFRYKYFGCWYFLGDTNLIHNTYTHKPEYKWSLITNSNWWHSGAEVHRPSIILDQNLFNIDHYGYVTNSVDEILDRLPKEVQNEIIFNLHRFTGNQSA